MAIRGTMALDALITTVRSLPPLPSLERFFSVSFSVFSFTLPCHFTLTTVAFRGRCRGRSADSLRSQGNQEQSMAFEQCFARGWKHVSGAGADTENYKGCFDCNICLDSAHEPVVTLCGHLYCWPCIYKWLHIQSASLAPDEHPQCPVCKADISHTTMVPLYGRGETAEEVELETKALHRDIAIPPRPSACGSQTLSTPNTGQQLPYRNPYQRPNHDPLLYSNYEEDSAAPLLNLTRTSFSGFHHPVVGMLGEMVYARVFGNSDNLYAYPNSYYVTGSSSNRMRRQQMQVDKSLNRISIFLLCCVILCVIVF